MNNRQTGRRRGRNTNNNNRNQGNRGGADRENRIDNRARGNAAQMLEKYKKMAQDAQVNGDRVNAEYYHQFADHYFRVNADTQARREEQRQARDEQRGQQSDRSGHDRNDNRDDRHSDSDDQDNSDNQDRSPRARQQNGQENGQHQQSGDRKSDRSEDQREETVASGEDDNAEQVVEKKPVRARRPRKAPEAKAAETKTAEAKPAKAATTKAAAGKSTATKARSTGSDSESNGFDVSILPPAIAIQPDDSSDASAEDDGETRKKPVLRKRRTVKAKEPQEGDAAA